MVYPPHRPARRGRLRRKPSPRPPKKRRWGYDNADGFNNSFGTRVAIKSYDEAEKLLTYYTAKDATLAPNAVWSGETTKAVADDVKVLYVNQKDDKAGDEIGIVEFDDVKDLYNAYVVMKGDTGDDVNVISVIIIETSNETDLSNT